VARFVSVGYARGDVPGAGEAVPVFAYREDASWLGFALINGRWFSAPGEAWAPTAFFPRLGLHVGDTIEVSFDGQATRLKLVGEIFDQQDDDILLRTSSASVPVDPG